MIANPKDELLPGMYVHLMVDFGSLDAAYLVPEPALLRDASGPYVLLLDKQGKVALRHVTTAGNYKNQWIVTGGLAKGDRLIVSGIAHARPGQPAVIAGKKPAGAGKAASGGSR